MNPETNGHKPPYAVDFTDPALIARMIVLGCLHGDQDAIDHLARRRPDLDIEALRLVAEVVVAVYLDMQEPLNANKIIFVRRTRDE